MWKLVRTTGVCCESQELVRSTGLKEADVREAVPKDLKNNAQGRRQCSSKRESCWLKESQRRDAVVEEVE